MHYVTSHFALIYPKVITSSEVLHIIVKKYYQQVQFRFWWQFYTNQLITLNSVKHTYAHGDKQNSHPSLSHTHTHTHTQILIKFSIKSFDCELHSRVKNSSHQDVAIWRASEH